MLYQKYYKIKLRKHCCLKPLTYLVISLCIQQIFFDCLLWARSVLFAGNLMLRMTSWVPVMMEFTISRESLYLKSLRMLSTTSTVNCDLNQLWRMRKPIPTQCVLRRAPGSRALTGQTVLLYGFFWLRPAHVSFIFRLASIVVTTWQPAVIGAIGLLVRA